MSLRGLWDSHPFANSKAMKIVAHYNGIQITLDAIFHWWAMWSQWNRNSAMQQEPNPGESKLDSTTGSTAGGGANKQPLEVVWHRYGDQLRRRARTRLRQYGLSGQAESMDICNDVMADLTRRFRTEPMSPDDVLAYVLRAIDNQVLDTFRGLARQCRDFRRNEATPVEDFHFAGQATTPSQIALRREVLDRIRSMLSQEDAQAVNLMLENRDWNEIGASLGIAADAARMRVKRAIERVRQDLAVERSGG